MEQADEFSDDDEFLAPVPQICISFFCPLCRFPFERDSTVVTCVDGRISPRVAYGDLLGPKLRRCSNFCLHYNGRITSYHSGCLEVSRLPSEEFRSSSKYDFKPLASEVQRRFDNIHGLLSDRLAELGTVELPTEIRSMVARELVRECAVNNMDYLCSTFRVYGATLDISLGVWGLYINIDGTEYLATLSNTMETRSVKLLDINTAQNVDIVYVGADYLGVRQLIFANLADTDSLPSSGDPTKSVWWRALPVPIMPKTLAACSDNIKLRYIRSYHCPLEEMLWSVPTPSSEHLHFWTFAPHIIFPLDFAMPRMDFIPCNEPGITGYSAGWGKNIMTIHAHRGDEDTRFYKDFDPFLTQPLVWVHMPIDPGETISDVWMRRGKEYRDMGLIFRTDKGKRMMVAPSRPPPRRARLGDDPEGKEDELTRWQQACSMRVGPTRIYFNYHVRGIHKLGFETGASGGATLPLEMPFPCLTNDMQVPYFYSSATLENVTRVTPCRRRLEDCTAVTGLLLRYADGGRAALGEVRLDCVGEGHEVDPWLQRLHLGFAKSQDKPRSIRPNVSRVELTPTAPDCELLRWLSLPWDGKLEWWYNDSRCRIYYEGQEVRSLI